METPFHMTPRPFEERLLGLLVRLQAFAEQRLGAAQADDVVQETLLRAWRGRGGFDDSRDLWPWLRTVAENVAVRRLEVESRQPEPSMDGVGGHADPRGSAGERELPFDVRSIIARLPHPDQEVVERFYFGGSSIADIARDRDCPEGTIKSQLSRARRRLAALLAGLVLGAAALLMPPLDGGRTDNGVTRKLVAEDAAGSHLDSLAKLRSYSISVEHSSPAPPQLRRVDRSQATTCGWTVVDASSSPSAFHTTTTHRP